MKLAVFCIFVIISVVGCSKPEEKREIKYASYEDCLLDKLGRGQSKIASANIVAACKEKFDVEMTVEEQELMFGAEKTASFIANKEREQLLEDEDERQEAVGYDHNGIPLDQEVFPEFYCTDDCSGHQAGYRWAREKGITKIQQCKGNSNSFIAGCMAFVNPFTEFAPK